MKFKRGKNPNSRNGFKKGHAVIVGTEKTRFIKGQPSWNKGLGKGTDKIKLKYRTYKSNAKKRGFTFEVSLEEFKKLVTANCTYCNSSGNGIDRIDNSLGYISGNMAACCEICNHMKWNLTKEEFIKKCREVTNNTSFVTVVGYEI